MALTPVKALVVRSPWAQEIAAGTKPIEYRSWRTQYRGWLAIVAARRRDSGTDGGRVVCLVRLTQCVEVGPKDFEWHLSDPTPLTERIEIAGRLGLFDVTDDLARFIPAPKERRPKKLPRILREIHQFLRRD